MLIHHNSASLGTTLWPWGFENGDTIDVASLAHVIFQFLPFSVEGEVAYEYGQTGGIVIVSRISWSLSMIGIGFPILTDEEFPTVQNGILQRLDGPHGIFGMLEDDHSATLTATIGAGG